AYKKDKEEIEVSYKLENSEIGFALSEYDKSEDLTIDPKLVWATYYGGSHRDYAPSISIDKNNNIYVVGSTHSTNFPLYNPGGDAYFQEKKALAEFQSDPNDFTDVYIIKFNSDGVRLWATYYGGSGDDKATSISIDNNNNLYVVGETWSYTFPVYNPGGAYFQEKNAGKDVFIIKFNSNGMRLWATYYGGEKEDRSSSISIDKDNNIYIVGSTRSENFPIYNSEKDAYFQDM
ncbi:MAG: SBBP repeat-containing protein, partial [Candidatus Hydrothermales bacterium]